jgi:hypothetical protein
MAIEASPTMVLPIFSCMPATCEPPSASLRLPLKL